jgi:FkbM family methyltransferase
MIIDKNYVLSRIATLTESKDSVVSNVQDDIRTILKIKYALPKWARSLIFSPYNPFFSMIKQSKVHKKEKDSIKIVPSNLALNFIIDCLLENVKLAFDTSLYYTNQDDDIVRFIDNRILCALNCMEYIPMDQKQKEDKENMFQIRRMLKKSDSNYYSLTINNHKYFLPGVLFNHHVFFQHYGLKYFSSFSKYIADKVFLDIGAYCGDASLIFTQYHPSVIYAYEPESRNFNLLKKTIEKNNIKDIVIPIKKGLGDEKGIFNITISGTASTLNTTLQTTSKIEKVEISTLNDDCMDKNVGLIKMDVEGFEYNVIKGGLEMIKKNKPILLISLYHTAKDFFEIPPMILSVCPDYKLKIIDLEPFDLITEKILVCYPSFLIVE